MSYLTTFPRQLWHHSLRFKEVVIYGSIILSLFVWMLMTFIPMETMDLYIEYITEAGLISIVGDVGEADSGLVFWIGMQLNLYLYYVLVIVAILIGARLFPTTDEDNVELLVGSVSRSIRPYFLENILSGILVLFLTALPSLVVLCLYTVYEYDSIDIVDRVILSYFYQFTVALFFMLLAASTSVLHFSKSAGKKWGFGYLIYSFLVEMQSGNEEAKDALNSSISYYVGTGDGFISGEFDWEPIYVTYVIIVIMLALSTWKIKSRELIEKAPKTPGNRRGLSSLISPESKISQKYPIFFEQIRQDMGLIVGWSIFLLLIGMYLPYLFAATPAFDGLIEAFDIAFISIFTLGYSIPNTYTGFMGVEFYGILWMYFGLPFIFVAASIPNREVRKDSQDVLFGNNIRMERVVVIRTLAMLIEIVFLVSMAYLGQVLGEIGADIDIDRGLQLQAFTVILVCVVTSSLLFLVISLIPRVSSGRKYSILAYVASLVIIIVAFFDESLEWLKNFSIYVHGDAIGVIFGERDFVEVLLLNLAILVFVLAAFYALLRYRYRKADLI